MLSPVLKKIKNLRCQPKIFFGVARVTRAVAKENPALSYEEREDLIAKRLSVSPSILKDMRRLMRGTISLNEKLPSSDGNQTERGDLLISEGNHAETVLDDQNLSIKRQWLAVAMKDLNDRERDILLQRKLSDEPKTLEQLSGVYGVSKERVRQLENKAFMILQKKMHSLAQDMCDAPAP